MKHDENIIYICHRIPYPPNKGDKIRSYNILKYLCERYNVYLVCLIDDDSDDSVIAHLANMVENLIYERINPISNRYFGILYFLKKLPISISYFYSHRVQRKLDSLIETVNFKHVFCYSSPTAEYVFRSKYYGKLTKESSLHMDFIDMDSYKWKQYADSTMFPMNIIYRYEAHFLLEYEKRVCSIFNTLLITTSEERKMFEKQIPVASLTVLNNGVDHELFSPSYVSYLDIKAPIIIFTGVMDYWPNIDGVTWFANDIFPIIQKSIPDAKFFIVGSKPVPSVRKLAERENVIVTGFVEDVRDYYAKADLCVVPLRVARGIQNKVLEGMAMGKVVVCTPNALSGIVSITGEEIRVEDSELEFANTVIELLNDRCLREYIGIKARNFIVNHYTWSKNLEILDDVISKK